MLDRVLLDANVVLNAAFIRQSWSRLVVGKLVQQQKALFVGSRSLAEAVASARKIALAFRKKTDPAIAIEQFVRQIGAVEVPPSSDPVEAAVPAHDHHVVCEAITANATLFTSDGDLWAGCNAVGRAAVLPLQALRFLDGVLLSTVVFGIAPGRHSGSVFARVHLGSGIALADVSKHTVTDFFGRLWLYYCAQRRAWVAEMPEIGRVAVPAEIAANAMQVIAVSWQASKSLQLRVAGIESPCDVAMRHPLHSDLLGNVSIGNHASGHHSLNLNGAVNVCVMNDRPIGVKQWRVLRTSAELTPNPYDDDRLRQAMNQLLE